MKYIKYIAIVFLIIAVMPIGIGLIIYHLELDQYIEEAPIGLNETKPRPAPIQTEVYIIRTLYFETDQFKKNDLYRKIENVSPSLIFNGIRFECIRAMPFLITLPPPLVLGL